MNRLTSHEDETCIERCERLWATEPLFRHAIIAAIVVLIIFISFAIYYTYGALSVQIPDQSKFLQEMLESHNKYRALHDSPPLELSKGLTDNAMDWAKTLARKKVLKYRYKQNRVYGENVYMSNGSVDITGEEIVKVWYDEIEHYNFEFAKFSRTTGHFTQIVWKNTKELGCAIALNDMWFVVCNYDPPGNNVGSYKSNVNKAIEVDNEQSNIDDPSSKDKSSGGETSGGETSGGETSGGETSGGETSGGETSEGETSDGDTSSDALRIRTQIGKQQPKRNKKDKGLSKPKIQST